MPRRRPSKVSDENPAQPVVGELALGLTSLAAEKKLETDIRQDIWKDLKGRKDIVLYRNAVGKAWNGKFVVLTNPDDIRRFGKIIITHPTPIVYGLCPGSSDQVGWLREVITQEMVGTIRARPVLIELKTKTGRLSPKQEAWLSMAKEMGCIAGVARSAEEAKELLK